MQPGIKQRLKQNAPSKGDFVCWCEKAFGTLSLLRKHQEFLCAITIRRKLQEVDDSIEQTNAECVAQHKADLVLWKNEKARGVPTVSN
jgi:hypothetical protein